MSQAPKPMPELNAISPEDMVRLIKASAGAYVSAEAWDQAIADGINPAQFGLRRRDGAIKPGTHLVCMLHEPGTALVHDDNATAPCAHCSHPVQFRPQNQRPEFTYICTKCATLKGEATVQ